MIKICKLKIHEWTLYSITYISDESIAIEILASKFLVVTEIMIKTLLGSFMGHPVQVINLQLLIPKIMSILQGNFRHGLVMYMYCCMGAAAQCWWQHALSIGTLIFNPLPTNSTPLTDHQKYVTADCISDVYPTTKYGAKMPTGAYLLIPSLLPSML